MEIVLRQIFGRLKMSSFPFVLECPRKLGHYEHYYNHLRQAKDSIIPFIGPNSQYVELESILLATAGSEGRFEARRNLKF